MGVLWTVWPLDEQMCAWLDEQGIDYPNMPSRFPTGREIKEMLAAFPGGVEVSDNGVGGPYSSFIDRSTPQGDQHTLLQIIDFTGDDAPQELWFEKGDEPLIIDVVRRLTPVCGPLTLVADVGDPPQVIE